MSATVSKIKPEPGEPMKRVTVTPEMATKLLEGNKENRPIRDGHVQRIANQIRAGRWKFNGDTIKISVEEDVLDGQHRLWAVITADAPIDTIIVRGIERDAFATIDTIRQSRTWGDTVSLSGRPKYRNIIAGSLGWLTRWQRGTMEGWKLAKNRLENSDIEEAFASNPGITRAVERANRLSRVANPSIIAFLCYVVSNRNPELAERMMSTLEDPSGVGVHDPFYVLRAHFSSLHGWRKAKVDSLVSIAVAFKAINAAGEGRKVSVLKWQNQGDRPEPFPKLVVKRGDAS